MLRFPCSACAKVLAVRDELAGKRVKCPGCGKVVSVPTMTLAPAELDNQRTVAPTSPPLPERNELRTLPPSSEASEQPTNPSLDKPDVTQSPNPDNDHDSSLTDFLAPPQSDEELGRLGEFRILKILGHGGMGVVFMGEDPKLGRKVAIKAMLPHLAQSRSSHQRFLREAKSAAALEHDHIVPIFHVGEDRGAPYIVMPFLQGEPLDKTLGRAEKLSVAEILRIGRETAEGLAAAHERGLIHRDIKPANLWLEGKKARVKILDFGLARATSQDSGLTQQGAIVGTPAYMAPEQARGDTVDARCDLWALGVVLYRLCTSQQPFVGKDTVSTLMAVAMQDPKSPQELNPEIPEDLSNLVMHLLEKDPERRLDKAEEVVARIKKMEKDWARTHDEDSRTSAITTAVPKAPNTAIAAAPLTSRREPSTVAQPPRRKLGVLIGAAFALLALVAGSVVFFMQTPHGTVRVEINDPKIKVAINGEDVTFEGADSKTITVKAGQNGLTVKRDDFSFDTTKFELKKGGDGHAQDRLVRRGEGASGPGWPSHRRKAKRSPGGDRRELCVGVRRQRLRRTRRRVRHRSS